MIADIGNSDFRVGQVIRLGRRALQLRYMSTYLNHDCIVMSILIG